MSNASAAGTEGTNYRFAAYLSIVGAVLMLAHSVYSGIQDSSLPGVLHLATACMSAAIVMLAMTLTAVRGRNLGIALGMFGTITGLAATVTDLVSGDAGLLGTASLVCAFAGALIVGLSFRKPRTGYPQAAVYAALSGAVLLILVGAVGILSDDRFNGLAYLVPALGWAYLSRVLLGADPLPVQPRPAQTQRIRPTGQSSPTKKKRKPRKKR